MEINKNFGISVDFSEENGVKYNVHFYDSNEQEFLAYVMEDVEEYQKDINNDIDLLKKVTTVNDLLNFLTVYCGYTAELVSNGPDYSDINEQTFEFGNVFIKISF